MAETLKVGDSVTVKPNNGDAYVGVVRSVHETGYTIWLDGEAKDEGEVRTIHTSGKDANASVEGK